MHFYLASRQPPRKKPRKEAKLSLDRVVEGPYTLPSLELLVAGLTMKEVAARMGVSYHTVDTHVRHVYAKLQVRSRGGAVAKALRERIV